MALRAVREREPAPTTALPLAPDGTEYRLYPAALTYFTVTKTRR